MALVYRFLFYVIGLLILTFGICLTIKAHLGTGAWDAFNIVLTNWFGLTIGTWLMIDGLILTFLNAFLLKKKPDFLSLITIAVIGSLIDLWMLSLFATWRAEGLMIQIASLISGILIVGLGAAIYLQAKFPSSPIDNFMMAIKERFNVNLMTAKTIAEFIPLIPALILRGPVSIGTIIITITIGPSIQLFFPYFERKMNALLQLKSKRSNVDSSF